MIKTFTLSLIIIFTVVICSQVFGQDKRNIPYPILFVHGWTGSDKTWFNELVHLQKQGLNVDIDYLGLGAGPGSRLDFMLNSLQLSTRLDRNSGSPDYGDVVDLLSTVNPNNDVFVINFDNGKSSSQSNQSAITKQGFAVGLAVKKILDATGAEKIILFGHSMGGLAIREYLQNEQNWLTLDNRHHVAKLITSGTPHQGSNISSFNLTSLFGKDETSEAVRDLRSNTPANYLYGGHENNVPTLYQNKDIDCDGRLGYVTGLNQRPISLDLPYACIVGIGGRLSIFGEDGDDIVTASSANIFNLEYDKPLKGTLIYIDNDNQQLDNAFESTWHTKLPKETSRNHYALDEPEEWEFAYEIKPDRQYIGFLTPDQAGYDFDYDRYLLAVDQRGVLEFEKSGDAINGVKLFDPSRNVVEDLLTTPKVIVPSGGEYAIGIYGSTGASAGYQLHFEKYQISTGFCPLPSRPEITETDHTQICEGEKVTLTLKNGGYDSYKWYRNNSQIGEGTSIVVDKAGTYSVRGLKCTIVESSVNQIAIRIIPVPNKPEISMVNDSLVSSAQSGNQWYADGQLISGATSQSIKNAGAGSYMVRVSNNGCTRESDELTITGTEAEIETATVVYPNPSKGSLEVSTSLHGTLNFRVIDLQGREVIRETKTATNGKVALNLKMKPGAYLLKINSGNSQVSKKLLIE